MKFIAYTDGASSNNQDEINRVGGYGVALFTQFNGVTKKKDFSGKYEGATNNQMELLATIVAIRECITIDPGSIPEVIIRSDSQYVIQGTTLWLKDWKANGWRTKDNKEIKNKSMWIELDGMLKKAKCTFEKIKGDGKDKWNSYVDILARQNSGSMPKRGIII